MMLDPLERAGAESYPTFWDVGCRAPSASIDPPEDAYMAFVNSIEDDLGPDAFPDEE